MVDQSSSVTTSEQQAVPVAQFDAGAKALFDDTMAGRFAAPSARPSWRDVDEDEKADWRGTIAAIIEAERLTSLPCKSGEGAGQVTALLWLERAEHCNMILPSPGSPMFAAVATEMEEYAERKLARYIASLKPAKGSDEYYRDDEPLPPEAMARIDASWEQYKTALNRCEVPPEGWYCTRAAGHDGPCAAVSTQPESQQKIRTGRLPGAKENEHGRQDRDHPVGAQQGPGTADRSARHDEECGRRCSGRGEVSGVSEQVSGLGRCESVALTPDATQTREAELVAALEPFAEACNISSADDSESLYDTLAAEKLTWRDLRRARAALNARGGA